MTNHEQIQTTSKEELKLFEIQSSKTVDTKDSKRILYYATSIQEALDLAYKDGAIQEVVEYHIMEHPLNKGQVSELSLKKDENSDIETFRYEKHINVLSALIEFFLFILLLLMFLISLSKNL